MLNEGYIACRDPARIRRHSIIAGAVSDRAHQFAVICLNHQIGITIENDAISVFLRLPLAVAGIAISVYDAGDGDRIRYTRRIAR